MEKRSCHLCGSKRQRNLHIEHTAKRFGILNLLAFHLLDSVTQAEWVKAGKVNETVTCYRCMSLDLTHDDLVYMRDTFYPRDRPYRYKDSMQMIRAKELREEYK